MHQFSKNVRTIIQCNFTNVLQILANVVVVTIRKSICLELEVVCMVGVEQVLCIMWSLKDSLQTEYNCHIYEWNHRIHFQAQFTFLYIKEKWVLALTKGYTAHFCGGYTKGWPSQPHILSVHDNMAVTHDIVHVIYYRLSPLV